MNYAYHQHGMPMPMDPYMGQPPQSQMYPSGQVYPQGPINPIGGYGAPYQGGLGGGIAPMYNCMKCGGSGYRISRKGKTKKCKCIKQQEKRLGKCYGYSSSDSD